MSDIKPGSRVFHAKTYRSGTVEDISQESRRRPASATVRFDPPDFYNYDVVPSEELILESERGDE